jgi:hypothetical protein
MEINITEKEVCDIILQKLKDKESLLITRIGDGEIVALKPDLNEKGTNHFYYVHLGRRLSEKHVSEISNNLKNTILETDILGIPNFQTSTNSGNPYWERSRGILTELISDNENTCKPKLFCDMGIHYLLTQKNYLDTILKQVDEVYLITARDVKEQLQSKYPNLKTIIDYRIPGEYVYEDNKKIDDYYPNRFDELSTIIKGQDLRGKLLLLGGGFVGKQLGTLFSQQGGVSLDIGSVFDRFVGKITRGKGKGANKYNDPIL